MAIENNYRQRRFAPALINDGFKPYLDWRRLSGITNESLNSTVLKAHQEVCELRDAIIEQQGRFAILGESADIVNFAASIGNNIGISASTFCSNGRIITTFEELHAFAREQLINHGIKKPRQILPALFKASDELNELTQTTNCEREKLLLPLHELTLGATMVAHLLAANIGDLVLLKHGRNIEIKYTLDDMNYLVHNLGWSVKKAQKYLADRYHDYKNNYFLYTGRSFDDDYMKKRGLR
jgi:hypothetical protein